MIIKQPQNHIFYFFLTLSLLFTSCIPQYLPSPTSQQEEISTAAATIQVPSEAPTITYSPSPTFKPTKAVLWRALGASDQYIGALAVDPVNPTVLYAGSQSTIFRSETGGENWQISYTYEAGEEDTINKIMVNPDNPKTIFASIYNHGLIKSIDNGLNWQPANNGLTTFKILTMEFNPSDSDILYIGTESGLFRSINQGKSWTFVSEKFKDISINAIAFDPFSPKIQYVGTMQQGLFKSKDNGESWNQTNYDLFIQTKSMKQETPTWIYDIAINPIDPETIYLAGYGIFKSIDGGNSWQKMNSGLDNDLDGNLFNINHIQINPDFPDTLYALNSRDYLFRSDDGGIHWYLYNNGINFGAGNGPIGSPVLDPFLADIMYIGTWNAGAFTTRQDHIAYDTETPTPYDCTHGWTQLKTGDYAFVVGKVDDPPNRVRIRPETNAEQAGQVYPGMIVKIIEGPECNNGLVFWKIENRTIENGSGWTAEGNLQDYWLEPYK
ncbi:MAG: hypothetical protein JEZ00_09820 [Anaerolineaceae bacterium]|nr:hypothetical protein [Anaerolineaceae bacterium]